MAKAKRSLPRRAVPHEGPLEASGALVVHRDFVQTFVASILSAYEETKAHADSADPDKQVATPEIEITNSIGNVHTITVAR